LLRLLVVCCGKECASEEAMLNRVRGEHIFLRAEGHGEGKENNLCREESHHLFMKKKKKKKRRGVRFMYKI